MRVLGLGSQQTTASTGVNRKQVHGNDEFDVIPRRRRRIKNSSSSDSDDMEYFRESVDVAEGDEQEEIVRHSPLPHKSFVTTTAAGETAVSQVGANKSITYDLETDAQVRAMVAQRKVVRDSTDNRESMRGSDGRQVSGTNISHQNCNKSHQTGEADSDDRRFVCMRRRYRSVLKRAFLSAEYRRARMRRYIRYEDLAVCLRVACSTLDECGLNDVTSMFDVVRRSYFRSLYEASLHSFVLLTDTASSVHEALARAFSLFL